MLLLIGYPAHRRSATAKPRAAVDSNSTNLVVGEPLGSKFSRRVAPSLKHSQGSDWGARVAVRPQWPQEAAQRSLSSTSSSVVESRNNNKTSTRSKSVKRMKNLLYPTRTLWPHHSIKTSVVTSRCSTWRTLTMKKWRTISARSRKCTRLPMSSTKRAFLWMRSMIWVRVLLRMS